MFLAAFIGIQVGLFVLASTRALGTLEYRSDIDA